MARDASSGKEANRQRAERKGEDEPKGFHVSDRRHWVRRSRGDEMEEPVEPGERHPTFVRELTEKMERSEVTLREYITAHKKMKEETEAARARIAQDMERRLELHKQEFFSGLLPVLDNLERALAAGEDHRDYDGLLKGITLVRDLFVQKLKAEGVERMSAVGEAFNPEFHEAMSVVDVDTQEMDNTVIEELSPGYLYKDHLLRAAQVRVGQHALREPLEEKE